MKTNTRLVRLLLMSMLMLTVSGMVLGAGALTSTARAAAEADPAQRVAIDSFRGPQGAMLQDAVESALLRRYYLIPDAQVTAAARRSGVRLRSDEDFAEVGRSLNVAAFVTATVRRNKNWRIEMVVRNGETGEAVAHYDVTDRRLEGLAATLARATPRRLQVLLATRGAADAGDPTAAASDAQVQVRVRPPALPKARQQNDDTDDAAAERGNRAGKRPTPMPAPTAKKEKQPAQAQAQAQPADDEDDEDQTSDEKPGDVRGDVLPRPYLELGVGGRVFSRSMTFSENISQIPAYRLDRATAITIDMAFHPFALVESTRDDWIAGIGITGNVTYAMGITTEMAGADGRARTEVHGYELGLRYRAPLGIVDLIPRAAYLAETFAANVGSVAPDVDYRVLRAGLGISLALSRQAFMRASGDYLDVLSAGRLNDADRFPRAVTRGVDVSLGAGYAFADNVEAWVAVALRRYGYDMKSQQGDRLIAGGALDEYMSMTMGLTYRPSTTSAKGRN
ncbi:MAG: hypothetical protein QOI66_644 [Myxococcales bacterium]|nr:hypothetical protein [Myxococcales bacterium]